jgi:Kef-type K+ transport system membrane component KefB
MTPTSDPIAIFAILMSAILVAPLIFQRLRVPGLLGVICAGALVGPGGFGWLERDRSIVLLGAVGLSYLMFMAGLSMDLGGFLRSRRQSLSFGSLSFFLPMALALIAGGTVLDYDVAPTLLLGAIVGSHTLLAYPIVSRIGITKNRAITICMGGTLVTDLVSLGLLAVVIGSRQEDTGATYWAKFALSVGLFVAFTVLVLPRLGRWFFRRFQYDNITDFLFMMTVLFGTAWLAQLAGLASIIGAFLAGLMMNRLVPESSTLMSRIQFVGNALLIPFFLLSVGMLIDVSVLTQLDVWATAALFTTLVLLGKGGSALLAGGIYGFSWAERWVMAGLTIPQAAATLAVTLVGFEYQLFGATEVNAVVLMILVSCLIGPVLVENSGRAVALQDESTVYDPTNAPQRILVPLANPETATHLMEIAFMVQEPGAEDPIYPISVTPHEGNVVANVASTKKMLQSTVDLATAAGRPVNALTRIDLNVAKGISRAVLERGITKIIIGWNGQQAQSRAIFGSILDQLLEETQVLTLVCKIMRPVNLFRRLLVPVPPLASLEPGFAVALRSIKLMAEGLGAGLVFVRTADAEPHLVENSEQVRPQLEASWEVVEQWEDVEDWIKEQRRPDDLLVLLSARNGAVSWRPSLDRIPQRLARETPDLCMVVVYPAELEWSEIQPTLA